MELQARTLEVVSGWRRQIREATDASAAAPIGDVLSRTDLAYPYIVKVLDVHPCMGKVAGRRLLDELRIDHRTRLSGLTHSQVDAIGRRCRCARA